MKKKEFDAVKMMREIRDKMSKQYSKMTIEGEIEDLQKKFSYIQWKKRQKQHITSVTR